MPSQPNAILLDTNLLVLLVVGQFDLALVGRRRLDVFSTDDFELLKRSIGPFPRTLTTPHVLAEMSNIADQCVPGRHADFRLFLRAVIRQLDESWTPAAKLCDTPAFQRLGVSDAAVCKLAEESAMVFSVDAELCSFLWGRGIHAVNFNHLRDV